MNCILFAISQVISMILGKENLEIVEKAMRYQSEMTDGVVQYNYETDELFGAGFTTGTVENPANPFIEVYRLPQGESGEIDMKCHENGDCPYWVESEDDYCGGHFDEEMVNELYSGCRINCCMEAYVDDGFEEDFENNFKEGVESQIRDVLSDYLGDTLSKLNEIRILCSDIVAPYDYFNVRQDNWEMDSMDMYVDNALEHGLFTTTECTPLEYMDADVQYLAGYRESDNELLQKVGCLVEDGDLDGALKLLQ